MFVQIDGNGKFGDGIHRILDPLPYFALGIFVCQVSSVASPSCLNLNSQGEASLLLLGGATVVSSRSLPSSSFHGFPRAICHLLFIIFQLDPVGQFPPTCSRRFPSIQLSTTTRLSKAHRATAP